MTTPHAYFIGICGTGTHAVAGLFRQLGWEVSGSDRAFLPPVGDVLKAEGVRTLDGYIASNVPERADLVVIGNAVRRDNPEVVEALGRGFAYRSFPAAVEEWFLADRHPIVVTGTHGKTTTTALIAWLLHATGRDPSFLVGGVPRDFGHGYRLGRGPHFVIEGDEYDTAFFDKQAKFLHYRPRTAIVTGIEFDHGDIYPDLAAIVAQFEKFVALLPSDGLLLIDGDSATAAGVAARASCRVVRYGLDPGCDWHASDLELLPDRSRFDLWRGNERLAVVTTPFSGEHNVRNAVAALAVVTANGVPVAEAVGAAATFGGVRRRLELRFDRNGIALFDDFAHHPTEVRETLRGVRARFPDRRLIAVFEPRTNTSRSRVFQADYPAALGQADLVVLADLPGDRAAAASGQLDVAEVGRALAARGVAVHTPGREQEITSLLTGLLVPGDVVVVMSAGHFGGLVEMLERTVGAG